LYETIIIMGYTPEQRKWLFHWKTHKGFREHLTAQELSTMDKVLYMKMYDGTAVRAVLNKIKQKWINYKNGVYGEYTS